MSSCEHSYCVSLIPHALVTDVVVDTPILKFAVWQSLPFESIITEMIIRTHLIIDQTPVATNFWRNSPSKGERGERAQ